MSSIYRDKWESEAEEEMKYLAQKKVEYGWTQQDAERHEYLKRELEK